MNNASNFSHSATVLTVQDLSLSKKFYIEKLGFQLSFEWGDPIEYAVLKSGAVNIHLSLREHNKTPNSNQCSLYIFVHDINVIFDQCKTTNIAILNIPEQRDYNMTDFDIKDPDGHIITFGNGQS